MVPESDLGIYSDVPFLDRLIRVFNVAWWIVAVNPISGAILDIAISLLFIFVVSSRLRALPHGRWFGAFVVALLVISTVIYGIVLVKIFPTLQRMVLGDSVFGKIGGMPRKLFFTSLKLAHSIKYEFNQFDSERLQQHAALDRDLTEALLKRSYLTNVYKKTNAPPEDLDTTWAKLWNETILNVGTEGSTLRDALTSEEVAFSLIPMQLTMSTTFVSPVIKISQLILFYVLTRYLNDTSPLITMIQLCIGLSFILSILWFIYHAYRMNEIEYIGVLEELPAELQKEFAPRLQQFENMKVRPTKITLNKRYLSIVRNYLVTSLGRDLLLNTIFTLVLVGVSLVIGRLAFPGQFGELALWYRRFAFWAFLISLLFLIGYYVSFWILQHVRTVVAPILASLVGALSPFLISFILTGKFQLSQFTSQLSATLAAAGILFT
ncbi:MAG TPA: hypothetical protein VFU37_24160, partial [Pyrinomonadaceae bacterium]|nr:hypothetical protein [Pyrinomonadaceae bacterium]